MSDAELILVKSTEVMKSVKITLDEMIKGTSPAIQAEVAMEFAISNRISKLMELRGLSKTQFAKSLDKRPSEVTKWLSGQHNFTIKTISLLSSFFGEPLITVLS